MPKRFRLRKGDDVVVISGRDKGKTGSILRVIRSEDRVIVDGINMVKRHTRPSQAQPGGIVDKEAPIHISNVALADPKDGSATRVGYKFLEDGRKVRVAKQSGVVVYI